MEVARVKVLFSRKVSVTAGEHSDEGAGGEEDGDEGSCVGCEEGGEAVMQGGLKVE